MKPTLFEIAKTYRDDIEKLGDLDLPDDAIADTLEGMEGEITVKARSIAAFAADLDTTAAAMKDAEARMKARRVAVERRAERLRHYLLSGMQYAGIERIDGPEFCLRIKSNPPKVDVFQPELIPAHLLRTPEPPPAEPNKTAIAAELKAGRDVPGCRLLHSQRIEIA